MAELQAEQLRSGETGLTGAARDALLAALPVAVYACEAPSGAIIYYNRHAAALWGRLPATLERFCGSHRLFLPDGTPLPHESCPMAVALEHGRAFRDQEVIIERTNGSRITALVSIEPVFDGAGRVAGAVNVFLDVSARKQAELALQMADRRKDAFLATLSHELRNPLAPMGYAIELLKRAGEDAAAVRKARDTLERQMAHLVRLVDDLLDLSRITHDKLELRRETVELADVVQQAIDTSRPWIGGARHRLTVELPGAAVRLHADGARLTQVVGNLLANAGKYTPAGGEIRVAVVLDEAEVTITVTDDGDGIAPDRLRDIFEPFVQAQHRRALQQGGLGVGLTLVKRLVELHGGSVEAFSDGPGTGSRFVVRLPLAPAVPAAQHVDGAATTLAAAPEPRRVLVVEDNLDSAEALATLLALDGHQVEQAHDGLTAIATAVDFSPDVVLLDLGLPGLDGYDVCRTLRRRAGGGDLVIVALTGWGEAADRQRSRQAGFDHHLVKPVERAALDGVLAVR